MQRSYYYQCGDGAEKRNTSPVISFKTPPGPSETVSMALLGDWGYLDSDQRPMDIGIGGLALNWTATLVRELLEDLKTKDAYSLSFILGDIGYADDSFGHKGETLRFGYEPAYDGFMAWNENITNTIPMMVTPGNHESECHDPYCILRLQDVGLHLNNFSAYNTRWAMPSAESGGVLNMWYSFNWGPVHITSINTETDWVGAGEETTGDSHFKFLPAGGFGADGQYLSWLEADLAAAAADPQVSWIIAAGHRPFEDLPQDHRETLVGLFEKYGVAMYFAGHGHTYIRLVIYACVSSSSFSIVFPSFFVPDFFLMFYWFSHYLSLFIIMYNVATTCPRGATTPSTSCPAPPATTRPTPRRTSSTPPPRMCPPRRAAWPGAGRPRSRSSTRATRTRAITAASRKTSPRCSRPTRCLRAS